MTDRIRTLTVQLDEDYRVDDAEQIIQAIRMVKGVRMVNAGELINMNTWTARMVVYQNFQEKIFKMLEELRDGK